MKDTDIYVRLAKAWGGFQVDDVVRFGYSKGLRHIEAGGGVKVKKQRAVNDPEPPKEEKGGPKAETATAVPKAENAMASPEIERTEPPEKKDSPRKKAGK